MSVLWLRHSIGDEWIAPDNCSIMRHRCSRNCIGCECPSVSPSGWQFLLTDVSTTRRHVTYRPAPTGEQHWLPAASTLVVVGQARCSSHRTRDHRRPCVQFHCSSCVKQFANGSAVFWVTGHFSTPPENWTVRAFLQLTPRLSNDYTAAWLTFTFPQLFAVAATLKSINYNVAMTFILIIILIITVSAYRWITIRARDSHSAALCMYFTWPVTESRRQAIRHCTTHSDDTTGICWCSARVNVALLICLSATMTSTLLWPPVNKYRH